MWTIRIPPLYRHVSLCTYIFCIWRDNVNVNLCWFNKILGNNVYGILISVQGYDMEYVWGSKALCIYEFYISNKRDLCRIKLIFSVLNIPVP